MQVPDVANNPNAAIAAAAADLAFSLANQFVSSGDVLRPDSYPIEKWEALMAAHKTGAEYLSEARKENPLDPAKIVQPSP